MTVDVGCGTDRQDTYGDVEDTLQTPMDAASCGQETYGDDAVSP